MPPQRCGTSQGPNTALMSLVSGVMVTEAPVRVQ